MKRIGILLFMAILLSSCYGPRERREENRQEDTGQYEYVHHETRAGGLLTTVRGKRQVGQTHWLAYDSTVLRLEDKRELFRVGWNSTQPRAAARNGERRQERAAL